MSDRVDILDSQSAESPNGLLPAISVHQNSQDMIRIRGARQHNSQEYRPGTATRSLLTKQILLILEIRMLLGRRLALVLYQLRISYSLFQQPA